MTTGSLEHVKFAPQSFDLSLMGRFEHVRNPLATLRAVHQLLKSGERREVSRLRNSDCRYPTVSAA